MRRPPGRDHAEANGNSGCARPKETSSDRSRSSLPSIAESIAAPAIQILPNPAPPSPQSPRTLALCFADHQICGSRPGLIIKGLRSTYVVRKMHKQVAAIENGRAWGRERVGKYG